MIESIGREQIARPVESERKCLAGSRAEDGARPIGCEFVDRACKREVLVYCHGKDVAGLVRDHTLKLSVSGVAKDTPVSERREFEQLPMKTTAGRRDECGSYDKIAAAIKRQSPWLSQPGGERRLHCRRRILGD